MTEPGYCTHDRVDQLRYGFIIDVKGQRVCMACGLVAPRAEPLDDRRRPRE